MLRANKIFFIINPLWTDKHTETCSRWSMTKRQWSFWNYMPEPALNSCVKLIAVFYYVIILGFIPLNLFGFSIRPVFSISKYYHPYPTTCVFTRISHVEGTKTKNFNEYTQTIVAYYLPFFILLSH